MGAAIIDEAHDEKAVNEEAGFFKVTFQTMFFQAVMALVSLYFGMLFTNWGFAIIEDEWDDSASNANFSMWVKIGAQWFTIALFTVSITIQICCDRYI